MNCDGYPGLGEDPPECCDLMLVRMHATRRQQTEQVGGAAGFL